MQKHSNYWMMPFAIPRTYQLSQETSHELNNLKVFVAQYQFLSAHICSISTNFSALVRPTCAGRGEMMIPSRGGGEGGAHS